jgi:hypothetical protein
MTLRNLGSNVIPKHSLCVLLDHDETSRVGRDGRGTVGILEDSGSNTTTYKCVRNTEYTEHGLVKQYIG